MTDQSAVSKQNCVEGSKSVKRFEAMDGFRGIAALWIVVFHLLLSGTAVGPYRLGTFAFLVISGFAIFNSVNRGSWGRSAAISFVKRRFLYIYGPYLLCLFFAGFVLPIACAMIEALKGRPSPIQFPYTCMDWIQVVSLVRIFSSKSWDLSLVFSPLDANWYLAIAAQIYLIVAVAIFVRSRKVLLFVTFLSLLALLPSVKKFVPYGLFLPYWLPFSVGMVLSHVIRKGYVLRVDWQRDRVWYVGGICVYGAGVSLLLWLFYAPLFFALAVAFLLWLVYPIDGRVASWLPWRAFKVIGLMSYGLYLVHIPVARLIMGFIPNPSRFPTQISHPLLWVPVTIFMSYLWSVFFQRPGSIRGCLFAVARPLKAATAAFREDWHIVFPSQRSGQEKDKKQEARTSNPVHKAHPRLRWRNLFKPAFYAVAARVLAILYVS